jgi:tRNA(Arg) A34 adenosine deaminase TadA
MRRALSLAAHAHAQGEVPVGAVLVRGDTIIGEGWKAGTSSSPPLTQPPTRKFWHSAKLPPRANTTASRERLSMSRWSRA